MTVRFDAVTVDWFGLATVRLEGQTGAVVYLDPGPEEYDVLDDLEPRDGDLILISHDHHYDPDSIRRVASDDALVVVHESIDASEIDRVDEQPEALPFEVERVAADEWFVLGHLTCSRRRRTTIRTVRTPTKTGRRTIPKGRAVVSASPSMASRRSGPVTPTPSQSTRTFRSISCFRRSAARSRWIDARRRRWPTDSSRTSCSLVHYDTFAAIEINADAFVVDVAHRGVPVVLDE